MAATKPVGKPGAEEETAPVHRIRITLTSRNVKNLEKGTPSGRLSPANLTFTSCCVFALRDTRWLCLQSVPTLYGAPRRSTSA